jgi:glycerophosphoryl diester phosphodiesterase
VPDTTWAELGELDLGEGHHPALLDEVMAAIPGTPIQLEVKNLPFEPGYEPDHRLALETADRARAGDLLTGFNPEMLAAVRKTFPDVTTGLAVPSGVDLDEAVKLCVKAGHRLLIPDHSLIVDELNVDLDVYPWTVNDEHRASELVELGVRGIITDDPGLMTATFRSNR